MRFFTLFFFFFVTFVSSFDFDYDSKNDVVPDNQVIAQTSAILPTINTTPATTTNTTTTTTTTLAQERPLGREVSEVVEKKEGKIEVQQIELISTTTTPTPAVMATPKTTSCLSETKLEVVVTRSMYRLIDEAFRERLVNFESRIASLLSEREKIREDIQQFNPAFDASFFDEAFTTAVKTR